MRDGDEILSSDAHLLWWSPTHEETVERLEDMLRRLAPGESSS